MKTLVDLAQDPAGAKLVADLAAAVVAHQYSLSNDDALVKLGLRCCRDLLLAQGYTETALGELHDEVSVGGEEITNKILVAGCQDDDWLESRVDAAIKVNLYGVVP